MNLTHPRPERTLTLSLAIYRALLLLYPARFRRQYAIQMAQVFHASCRDAERRRGFAGIVDVWRRTLGDLVVTALAERMEQDMTMARSVIYRATGAVSLAGVAIWILGIVALVALYTARVIGPMPPPIVIMSVPVAWVFFIVGLCGLYAWLGKRVGALVWLPGVVAIAAVALLLVAEVYTAYTSQIGVQYMGSATVVNLAQRSQLNEQLQYDAYLASCVSYPVLGLALVVTGLLTLRAPALRTVARTLLLMGAVGMLYYFFTDMGAPSLLRNTGTPGLLGMVAGALVFYGVWLFGWLRLGRWLWQAGEIGTAAPPTPQAGVASPAPTAARQALD